MKKIHFFALAIAFLTFTFCKNEKSTDNKSATPSVTNKLKGSYRHLKGTIDSFPITMDLIQYNDNTTEVAPFNFRGYYYYDKYQQPIAFYGETDSTGTIVLHEDSKHDVDICFFGKFDGSGTFSGMWKDTSTKKEFKFVLKETNADGALSFDFINYNDSLKLWKDNPKSPQATFGMEALVPSKNTEGGLAAFLKDKILGGIHSDTLEVSYANKTLDEFKNAMRDTFFKSYVETLKDEKPDTSGEVPAFLNYAETQSVAIIFNEKDLLSLGYSAYSYSGGAHGNHATLVASYDLAQKKVLKLTDVFQPNFAKTLNAALAKAVRQKFSLKANASLSEVLFDPTISYNDNFCITKKGILFTYNPYEIAAYAYGEIELFIPFNEVKSILTPRFAQ